MLLNIYMFSERKRNNHEQLTTEWKDDNADNEKKRMNGYPSGTILPTEKDFGGIHWKMFFYSLT